jgi:hypothetical protein
MKSINLMVIILFYLFSSISAQALDFYIRADDPAIQYMGRIDFSNPKAPSFSFPGISIKAKFNSSSIKAVIKDFGAGGAQTTNYYNVLIDGQFIQKLAVRTADTLYTLATGLDASDHTVELVKRTESSVGKSSFLGFVISSEALLPLDPKPTFKMEFIGDSWTCGYGNEVSTNSPNTGFNSVNEDNMRAWGYTVAKKFSAQYHATSLSGRGLYRNNSGTTTGVVPDEFDKIIPGQSIPLWDFSTYIPDLVVIHLGTNDLFPETVSSTNLLDSTLFVNKYIAFVEDIRTQYGTDTKIICAFGNSKSDWWPENLKHLTRWRNYVAATVKHFNDAGDSKVYSFELTVQSAPYGEDWHPTIVTHNQMANQIAPFISTITGLTASDYTAPLAYNTVTSLTSENNLEAAISIFPNPTSGELFISGIESNDAWQIFTSAGQLIENGIGQEVNIKEIKSGVYFLIVHNKSIPFVKF